MTSHNRKRRYGSEFLPVDEDLLINRDLREWFDDKKTIIDSKWIDDWLNSGIAQNDVLSMKGEIGEEHEPINIVKVDDCYTNEVSTEISSHTNFQMVNGCGLTNTAKYYFEKDSSSCINKWQQSGFEQVLPPNSKRKSFVTLKKEDHITYYTSSDSDSVDTAEYIRGSRGKGNKSLRGKNNLIKQHSDLKNIETNKTLYTEENIKVNDQKNTLEDTVSPYNNNIKARRKRFQKRYNSKLKKSPLYPSSSSSSDEVYLRHRNGIRNSRYLPQLNLNYKSSEETNNSDPDYKILDNVRKSHNTIVKSVNPSNTSTQEKSTTCISNPIAEPRMDFPFESEQQSQVNNSLKLVELEQNKKSNSSDEDNETDVTFMSNKKRFRLYGKYFVDQPLVLNNSQPNIQND